MKIGDFEVHPAAELFPLMEGKEFDDLVEDIRKNGQHEPIVFWKQMLIDGRNRLRACLKLGIPFKDCEQPDDFNVYDYVLSANLHRRHLTESQRAMVAAKLAKLSLGANQFTKEGASIEAPSQDKAAEMLQVGRSSVQRARTVQEKGSKDLVKAVEKGDIPVSKAAKIAATVPKQDQLKAATEPKPKPSKPAVAAIPPVKQEPAPQRPAKPAKEISLVDEQHTEAEQWILQFVRSRNRAVKLRLLLDELTEAEILIVQRWYESQVSVAD